MEILIVNKKCYSTKKINIAYITKGYLKYYHYRPVEEKIFKYLNIYQLFLISYGLNMREYHNTGRAKRSIAIDKIHGIIFNNKHNILF